MNIEIPGKDKSNWDTALSEATQWLVQIDDPACSHEQYFQWRTWLEQDPSHEKAFDEVAACSGRLAELREKLAVIPLPSDSELVSDTYEPTQSVAEWQEQLLPTVKNYRRYLTAAVVAVVAFSLIVFAIVERATSFDDSQPFRIATVESQHRQAQLDDGSIVEMGADSALTVSFSREQRTVVLEAGEALFNVANDMQRPFVVVAGTGTITAVGTSFNIRRDSGRVVVTVVEGSVTVSQQSKLEDRGRLSRGVAKLAIGQQVSYDAAGMARVIDAQPEIATSWQQGRLQYLREPLRFVITGVNRYSDTKIVIADRELENLLFTGTVFEGQTDEWLQGLASILPLEVSHVGNNTVLLRMVE